MLRPAACPIKAGKIKLPAPKNNPNRRLPTERDSVKVNLRFIPIQSLRAALKLHLRRLY